MSARRFTLARCLAFIAGVIVCLAGILSSGRTGYASYLASGRPELLDSSAVNRAIRLDGLNPHVRFARARMLSREGQSSEALKEFEKVVVGRPEHFAAWLNLGIARQRDGNRVGAVAAFAEAVRRAPSYAQPRARHGTALLLVGRRGEAFAEFRRAVSSNPTLAPPITAFLWEQVGKDAVALEQVLQPRNDNSKLSLANFLVKQGRAAEGVNLYREASDVPEETRHALVEKLIAANHFALAREVWAGAGAEGNLSLVTGLLTDSGFESDVTLDLPGFG